MTRINIDVSKSELDFIREAVLSKHSNLMSYLDACEEEVVVKPTLSEVTEWANKEFAKGYEKFKNESAIVETPKKPHWTQTAKGKKIMAARKRKGQ